MSFCFLYHKFKKIIYPCKKFVGKLLFCWTHLLLTFAILRESCQQILSSYFFKQIFQGSYRLRQHYFTVFTIGNTFYFTVCLVCLAYFYFISSSYIKDFFFLTFVFLCPVCLLVCLCFFYRQFVLVSILTLLYFLLTLNCLCRHTEKRFLLCNHRNSGLFVSRKLM